MPVLKAFQGARILIQSLKIGGNVRQYMWIAGIYMPVFLKDIAQMWKVFVKPMLTMPIKIGHPR